MMFYNSASEEQETQIWFDYFQKSVSIYTSKKSIYKRLEKELGTPNKIDKIAGEVTGGTWVINFNDRKRLRSTIALQILLGKIGKKN